MAPETLHSSDPTRPDKATGEDGVDPG